MLQSNTTNADLKSYSNGIYLLKKRKKGKRKKQAISLSSHDSVSASTLFFFLSFFLFMFLTLWHIFYTVSYLASTQSSRQSHKRRVCVCLYVCGQHFFFYFSSLLVANGFNCFQHLLGFLSRQRMYNYGLAKSVFN